MGILRKDAVGLSIAAIHIRLRTGASFPANLPSIADPASLAFSSLSVGQSNQF